MATRFDYSHSDTFQSVLLLRFRLHWVLCFEACPFFAPLALMRVVLTQYQQPGLVLNISGIGFEVIFQQKNHVIRSSIFKLKMLVYERTCVIR